MLVGETVRTAWRSLGQNRLRTTLTALGMIIGVSSVISTLAIGEGARSSVEGQIRSLGSNLLMVSPRRAPRGVASSGSIESLSMDDADALGEIDGIVAVSPEASGSAQIEFRESNQNASVSGITPQYLATRNIEVARGLSLSDSDLQRRHRVAMIGSTVASELFGRTEPLGERLQIRGLAFTVIGVLEEKGAGWGSPDDAVLVPLTTFQGPLFGEDALSTISLQVASEDVANQVQAQVESLLRLRHGILPGAEDDFRVRSQTEMLETMGEITGTFTALLGSVAGVSLLVGGIGIMNIMLVSVRERTREIGLRMAVGAKRSDILLQFLIESVVVSLFGGALGLLLGIGGAYGIAQLGDWETVVPSYSIVLALGVSVGIGLLFGVGPARSAARLDPVEALRVE